MKQYIDLGTIFDDLFDAANQFRYGIKSGFNGARFGEKRYVFDENVDYYPGISYPPMNVFLTGDRSLNFEFALAGFEEKNIELSFQGDYMIFSARIEGVCRELDAEMPNVHYLKRRLKLKDIEKQKYFVPMDKYAQERVQAVYKNGILKVTIPPKPEKPKTESISITIITEE
jgi:HSP20 family molecular chaperone IbpA